MECCPRSSKLYSYSVCHKLNNFLLRLYVLDDCMWEGLTRKRITAQNTADAGRYFSQILWIVAWTVFNHIIAWDVNAGDIIIYFRYHFWLGVPSKAIFCEIGSVLIWILSQEILCKLCVKEMNVYVIWAQFQANLMILVQDCPWFSNTL